MTGALPAYPVFLLSKLVFEVALPVLLAGVVGLPILIPVTLAQWWRLGGLMEVFKSSAWTLTYRELRADRGCKARLGERGGRRKSRRGAGRIVKAVPLPGPRRHPKNAHWPL